MKKILILTLSLFTLFVLTSCGATKTADIINPDATFEYFYGSTCPHCQELNAYMTKNDMYGKLPLEKREVYYNAENNKMFLALAKNLGIAESDLGVPFVFDKQTGKYTVGVQPAIDMFEAYIATQDETGSGSTTQTGAVNKTSTGAE